MKRTKSKIPYINIKSLIEGHSTKKNLNVFARIIKKGDQLKERRNRK